MHINYKSHNIMVQQFKPFCYLLLVLVFIFSCSSSVYSIDIGVRHGELGASRVHEMHQRWQWRSWMNHGSFRGPRKQLHLKGNPFDVPKLPV
ncbi:unnamed protein product [Withania somnifera]